MDNLQLQLFHFAESSFSPRPVPLDHFQGANVKVVFLGGLLHLTAQELTGSLAEILHDLLGEARLWPGSHRIYSIALGDDKMIKQLSENIYLVAEGQRRYEEIPITPEADKIVDEIILPPGKLAAWKPLPQSMQLQEAESYFGQIRFIGYSYGTSLIQQIDLALRKRLASAQIPPSVLENTGAVNIGPVVYPLQDGVFRQLWVFRKTDKVMQAALEDALISNPQEDYEIFTVGKTIGVGEYCGDEMLRILAVDKFPSGHTAPKLIYQFDFEGHDLRLYSNVPKNLPNREACTYPTSALGWVLREAMASMCSGSTAWSFETGEILTRLMGPQSHAAAQRETKEWLELWYGKFAKIVETFRNLGFRDAIEYIRRETAAMKNEEDKSPRAQKKPVIESETCH